MESSTTGVEGIYAVGDDFYVTTRDVRSPPFAAEIEITANSPWHLKEPISQQLRLAIGESGEYMVDDGSGVEEGPNGDIYVLKLDIEQSETNVCWKSASCTLNLTDDSYTGGGVEWTSSPAGISGSGNSITFSPNALTAGVYTVTARSGIVSSYTDTCIVRVFNVEFITPNGDPVLSPVDAGDGQNEFTFSGASTGVLTMQLKAKVVPASAASAITGCQFNVGDIGSSVKNWATNNPNGKAAVSDNDLTATVTFTGLPDNNSDFGKKTATVSCDGVICDAKDYEVFFPKEATNHPGGQVGSPNWFYYWKDGAVCGIPADSEYDPDGDGIPSSEEPTEDGISTLSNDPDTYRMGSSYSGYGDQEVRCRKIEQTHTLSVHPERDWANPGCQSKDQFGPNSR